jgi:hypothetical protein
LADVAPEAGRLRRQLRLCGAGRQGNLDPFRPIDDAATLIPSYPHFADPASRKHFRRTHHFFNFPHFSY